MSKNATRNRRKQHNDAEEQTKEKFLRVAQEQDSYEKPQPLPKFTAATNNQKVALSYLNSGTPIVFLVGSAGTGKSMLAAYRAACLLKQKKINKVYLVRPAVSVGKSVGMLPGDIKEKLAPYFAQTMAHLENFLGDGFMKYCVEKKIIEMKPVEYLRGMSFEDSFVVAEECQNFTSEEMEMMLTRLGKNCTMVFTGDQKQHDLKGVSGLEKTIDLFNTVLASHPSYLDKSDIDILDSGIGIVQFTPNDVVRSGLTKAFVKLYYYNTYDEKK